LKLHELQLNESYLLILVEIAPFNPPPYDKTIPGHQIASIMSRWTGKAWSLNAPSVLSECTSSLKGGAALLGAAVCLSSMASALRAALVKGSLDRQMRQRTRYIASEESTS